METIIKKAIEGGYKRGNIGFQPIHEVNCDFIITINPKDNLDIHHYGIAWIVLDPLFWQALGKACGWKLSLWSTDPDTKLHYLTEPKEFFYVVLTKGWDKAVSWLEELIK